MSEAKVIVITSGKGGVGKTTSSANIGMSLSKLGKKVCMVDLDIGLRKLDLMVSQESKITYSIMDAIRGECKLDDAFIDVNDSNNLFLLPAAQTDPEEELTVDEMKVVMGELRKYFDYVILDCPAGIRNGFDVAIADADEAIVVVNPEVPSLRDGDKVIGLLESKGFSSDQISTLITRYRPNMAFRKAMLSVDDIQNVLCVPLLGVIPEDEKVIVSTNQGNPIVERKVSKAGKYYKLVAKKISGEAVPDEVFAFKTFLGKILDFVTPSNSVIKA